MYPSSYNRPICERILPMGGGFLSICTDLAQSHQLPTVLPDWAYAFWWSEDGAQTDLRALALARFAPDPTAAKEMEELGKQQAQFAETRTGARQKYLRENAAGSQKIADRLAKGGAMCPTSVHILDATRVLLGYREGSEWALFRIIDVLRPEILWERTAWDIVRMAGETPFSQQEVDIAYSKATSTHEAALAVALAGGPAAFQPKTGVPAVARILAAHGDVALFGFGRDRRATVDLRTDSTAIVPGQARFDYEMYCLRDGMCLRFDGMNNEAIDLANGAPLPAPKGKLPGYPWNFAQDQSGRIVVGDDTLYRFTLPDGKVERFKVREASKRVSGMSLSPSGRWAVCSNRDEPDLIVLDLETGQKTWVDHALLGLALSDDLRLVLRPAISETDILVMTQGQLRRTPIPAEGWVPITPPRRKPGEPTELDTIAEWIAQVHRPCIEISAKPVKKKLSAGSSKSGGVPDLPKGTDWPVALGHPMVFIGQFDLAEVQAVCPGFPLPDTGLLSFFRAVDVGGVAQGFVMPSFYNADYPADYPKEESLVLYTADTSHLAPVVPPSDEYLGPQAALKLRQRGLEYPALDSVQVRLAGLSGPQREAYAAFYRKSVRNAGGEEGHENSHLGGYPPVIQGNDFEEAAEACDRGLDPLGPRNDDIPLAASARWTQLLHLDEEPGWVWGDGGYLHWMIPYAEMQAGDFGNVRVIGVN